MSADKILFIYLVALLGGVAALAIYSELRRRQFQPEPTKDHIFRCQKCGFVYTDDSDVDRSRCSQCGTMNEMIEF
jgi:predicted Zn-ribbon and HTH transcriptional regulator